MFPLPQAVARLLDPHRSHNPERTAALGRLLGEASHALVYATFPHSGGLSEPAEVYALLADLYQSTDRLAQVSEQLTHWLQNGFNADRLRAAGSDASPGTQGGQLDRRLRAAAEALGAAQARATGCADALRAAQNAIAGIAPR